MNQGPESGLVLRQQLLCVLRATDKGESSVDPDEERGEETRGDFRNHFRIECFRRRVTLLLLIRVSFLTLCLLVPSTFLQRTRKIRRFLLRFSAALKEREVDAWWGGGEALVMQQQGRET